MTLVTDRKHARHVPGNASNRRSSRQNVDSSCESVRTGGHLLSKQISVCVEQTVQGDANLRAKSMHMYYSFLKKWNCV